MLGVRWLDNGMNIADGVLALDDITTSPPVLSSRVQFYSKSNDAYVMDGSGNEIRLTSSGSLFSVFEVSSNVVRCKSDVVDYSTDDFIFGSPQLDDDGDVDHDSRMFFDKSIGAFRAGLTESTQWDVSNRGSYSVGFGRNCYASGHYSFAAGYLCTASGIYAMAHGNASVSVAQGGVSVGYGHRINSTAYYSFAACHSNTLNGENSIGLGRGNTVSGSSSQCRGRECVTLEDFGDASGYRAKSRCYSSHAFAGGIRGSEIGSLQKESLEVAIHTTTDASTVLAPNQDTGNLVEPPASYAYDCVIFVTGVVTATTGSASVGDTVHYTIRAGFTNIGGTVSRTYQNLKTEYESANMIACTVDVDALLTQIVVSVTGLSDAEIQWHASIMFIETYFG